jgi:hypothetical protein
MSLRDKLVTLVKELEVQEGCAIQIVLERYGDKRKEILNPFSGRKMEVYDCKSEYKKLEGVYGGIEDILNKIVKLRLQNAKSITKKVYPEYELIKWTCDCDHVNPSGSNQCQNCMMVLKDSQKWSGITILRDGDNVYKEVCGLYEIIGKIRPK